MKDPKIGCPFFFGNSQLAVSQQMSRTAKVQPNTEESLRLINGLQAPEVGSPVVFRV